MTKNEWDLLTWRKGNPEAARIARFAHWVRTTKPDEPSGILWSLAIEKCGVTLAQARKVWFGVTAITPNGRRVVPFKPGWSESARARKPLDQIPNLRAPEVNELFRWYGRRRRKADSSARDRVASAMRVLFGVHIPEPKEGSMFETYDAMFARLERRKCGGLRENSARLTTNVGEMREIRKESLDRFGVGLSRHTFNRVVTVPGIRRAYLIVADMYGGVDGKVAPEPGRNRRIWLVTRLRQGWGTSKTQALGPDGEWITPDAFGVWNFLGIHTTREIRDSMIRARPKLKEDNFHVID